MPILANGSRGVQHYIICHLSLPNYVTFVVPENWCVGFCLNVAIIASDCELFSMLLGLPVQEAQNHKEANYVETE